MNQKPQSQGFNSMQQIIPSLIQKVNSHSSVVGNPTPSSYISKSLFLKLKAEQHKITAQIVIKFKYKISVAATLHKLVNFIDIHGSTRVTHKRLAYELRCSTKTIERHLERFTKDGLLKRRKNGWKVSNTTVLLFLSPKLNNITDILSVYLNPRERPPKGSDSLGNEEEEKRGDSAWPGGRATPEDDIFEDEIPCNEEHRQKCLSKMWESLKQGVN